MSEYHYEHNPHNLKRKDIPTIDVLRACEADEAAMDVLVGKFNAPTKIALSAMERDEDKGLIEMIYVSPRFASLTDKGREMLTS